MKKTIATLSLAAMLLGTVAFAAPQQSPSTTQPSTTAPATTTKHTTKRKHRHGKRKHATKQTTDSTQTPKSTPKQ